MKQLFLAAFLLISVFAQSQVGDRYKKDTIRTVQKASDAFPTYDGISPVSDKPGHMFIAYQGGNSVDFTSTALYFCEFDGKGFYNVQNLFPSGLNSDDVIGNPNMILSPHKDSLMLVFFGYNTGGTICTIYKMFKPISGGAWTTPAVVQTGSYMIGSYDRLFRTASGFPFMTFDTTNNGQLSTQLGNYHMRVLKGDTGANWKNLTRLNLDIFPGADSLAVESGMFEITRNREDNATDPKKLVIYWRSRGDKLFARESIDGGTTWSAVYWMGLTTARSTITMKVIDRNVWAVFNRKFISPTDQNESRKELVLYGGDGANWNINYLLEGNAIDTIALHEGTIFYDGITMYVFYSTINKVDGRGSIQLQMFNRDFYNKGIVGFQNNMPELKITGNGDNTNYDGHLPKLSIYSGMAGHAAGYLDIGSLYTDPKLYSPGFDVKIPAGISFGLNWTITPSVDNYGQWYNALFGINSSTTLTNQRILSLANNGTIKFEVGPDGNLYPATIDSVGTPTNKSILFWDGSTHQVKRALFTGLTTSGADGDIQTKKGSALFGTSDFHRDTTDGRVDIKSSGGYGLRVVQKSTGLQLEIDGINIDAHDSTGANANINMNRRFFAAGGMESGGNVSATWSSDLLLTTNTGGYMVKTDRDLLVGGTLLTSSFSPGYVTETANYTATITDYTIHCTSNSFTVTLPTAVGHNRIYVIKNTGGGTITIATTSGQTIDGTTQGTVANGAVAQYQSTGTNWIKIN